MATILKSGMSGDDVKNLQTQLNSNGYSLETNGVYDDNTVNAVKDYQSKNGLVVDGIVGEKTTAKLNSSNTNSPTAGTTDGTSGSSSSSTSTSVTVSGGSTSGNYVQSQAVKDAYAKLQETLNGRPNDYLSQYDDQIKQLSQQILNRDPFSYDLNADMLYQQYKDQYTNLGQQAMRDTVGDVSNMTGGYANSYASTAGSQAYQSYLQQLNDRVPELYQLARDTYDRDLGMQMDQLNIYRDLDNTDYMRYADQLADYYNRAQLADSQYQTLYNQDYNQWLDQRNYDYQISRDAIEDAHWNQLHGGSGSGGSSSSGTRKYNPSVGDGDGDKKLKDYTSSQVTQALNAYYQQLQADNLKSGAKPFDVYLDKLASEGYNADSLAEEISRRVGTTNSTYNSTYEQRMAQQSQQSSQRQTQTPTTTKKAPTDAILATMLLVANNNGGTGNSQYQKMLSAYESNGYDISAINKYVQNNVKSQWVR